MPEPAVERTFSPLRAVSRAVAGERGKDARERPWPRWPVGRLSRQWNIAERHAAGSRSAVRAQLLDGICQAAPRVPPLVQPLRAISTRNQTSSKSVPLFACWRIEGEKLIRAPPPQHVNGLILRNPV